jgi:acetyl-CoA carboxylase biotin carboxyl carrier protein
MDIDELQRILELMDEHDLVEVELSDPERGTRIRLKKARAEEPPRPVPMPMMAVPPAADPPPAAAAAPVEERDTNLVEIPSPMVGTFYRAPSPDTDSFVEVGEQIDEETVVCIVEAMKVMNEIKAEVAGEVVEILVQNGEAVEYGQPLLLVRTE